MEKVVNDIRDRRIQLGLTQGRLAQALPGKVDAIALGFIENGRVLPTVDAMRTLCELFGCEPTDMYAPGDIDLLSSTTPAAIPPEPATETGGGRDHAGMTEFRTWLRPSEKTALNTAIAQLGYRNSAEWFREMLRNTIARNKRLHGAATPREHSVSDAL